MGFRPVCEAGGNTALVLLEMQLECWHLHRRLHLLCYHMPVCSGTYHHHQSSSSSIIIIIIINHHQSLSSSSIIIIIINHYHHHHQSSPSSIIIINHHNHQSSSSIIIISHHHHLHHHCYKSFTLTFILLMPLHLVTITSSVHRSFFFHSQHKTDLFHKSFPPKTAGTLHLDCLLGLRPLFALLCSSVCFIFLSLFLLISDPVW